MQFRWTVGVLAALLAIGGCSLFESEPPNLTNAAAEECVVLTTALDRLANDWRTNPGKRRLQIDTFAISADRIDNDYDARLPGQLPRRGVRPIDVGACGTPLASISNRIDVVSPDHPIPEGDRKSCWRSDGGWISRPGFDADHVHAAILYTDNVCGERSWLVRLTKDFRGIWYADAPDPLDRSPILPPQGG